MTSMVVVDASVLLANILGEEGGEHMESIDGPSYMSAVNAAEVRSKLSDKGMPLELADGIFERFDVRVVDFTDADSRSVATLRPLTRSSGLSIADRACLALGQRLKAVVITGDRIWKELPLQVQVELIR
jgi:ribonuclease VapC